MSTEIAAKERSIYEALFTSPDVDFTNERRLWISVVSQALVDAASTSPSIRADVGDWLESEDFVIVIGNAGMEEEFIRPVFHRIMNTKVRKVAFREAMKIKVLLRQYINNHRAGVDLERSKSEE